MMIVITKVEPKMEYFIPVTQLQNTAYVFGHMLCFLVQS